MSIQGQKQLQGKLFITAKLKLITGLHIGANSDFAPIGAVDSPFIRDSLTNEPIIPGSSLKGKLRTLLAKARSKSENLVDIKNDDEVISRLFGASASEGACFSRLQFFDLFMDRNNLELFKTIDTDTYIGEVKWENSIDRLSGRANPRQIERVPAGAIFDFKLVYNIERVQELENDIDVLVEGFRLLQLDYLGGQGSRGYGRVAFDSFEIEYIDCGLENGIDKAKVNELATKFKGSCMNEI